jgi:transcriptional regulator with XRE-family HTH domain
LTQDEFAQRCRISISFASLLERGERSPSFETLLQVAAALEVSPADLFKAEQSHEFDDPYFTRLLDFARAKHLTRPQVDRLIAVGSAMFDPGIDARNSQAQQAIPSEICSEKGCERAILAKGLCALHYHRLRRARL